MIKEDCGRKRRGGGLAESQEQITNQRDFCYVMGINFQILTPCDGRFRTWRSRTPDQRGCFCCSPPHSAVSTEIVVQGTQRAVEYPCMLHHAAHRADLTCTSLSFILQAAASRAWVRTRPAHTYHRPIATGQTVVATVSELKDGEGSKGRCPQRDSKWR